MHTDSTPWKRHPQITKSQALSKLAAELAASGMTNPRGVSSALANLLGLHRAQVSAWPPDEALPELQAWRLHSIRPTWFDQPAG